MTIVQLDIQGFRSLKNVSWHPGDLNVVIGPNGSGKSNLLRMLELISAAADGKLDKLIFGGGGIGQLLWDGQARSIQFSLTTSATGIGTAGAGFVYSTELEAPFDQNFYRVSHEVLTDTNDGFQFFERDISRYSVTGRNNDNLDEFTSNDLDDYETLFSSFSGGLRMLPWMVLTGLPFYRRQIANWAIYQDIRTDQASLIRQAPVSRLEEHVAPDGQNLINVLHTLYTGDRKFKQDINDAMYAAFGDDFDELIFPPAADQRIQMRVRWKTLKREQSTADLSDGTLRFLLLITVLASPNPPPLIAIDEPETGLHPSMLPIIAEFASEAATRTQVIFTTHSDQFLNAFRDTRLTVTVAKWENGETTLKTIDDAVLGKWLQEYTLGSLFRSGELEEIE
ncbi:MAG: AAA family ATPase [Janthinobacterium lividum]